MCLTVSSLSHSRSAQRPSAAKYRHTRHKQRDVTESVSFCCRHVTFQLRAAGWRLDGGGWVMEAGWRRRGALLMLRLMLMLMGGLMMLSGSVQPLLRMLHDRYTQASILGIPS